MESGEEKRRLIMGLLSLLLLLTGLGTLAGLALFSSENSKVEIIKDEGREARGDGKSAEEMVVDVSGAVEKPGVYRLWQGSRIIDALAAAGGLSAGADREFLSKSVNLSQLVADGIKIYIPEHKSTPGFVNKNTTEISGVGEDTIYINSASREELESLWGVGTVRAEAIISGRPYSSVEELVTRKIVPKNVVEKNKGRLGL